MSRIAYKTRCHRSAVSRRRQGGFTLIESALTTVIVGTGVLAIVAAQQAYHMKNDWAQRTGTAMLLANEVRELTLALPHHDPITGTANLGPETNEYSLDSEGANVPDVAKFDDLDDFAGVVSGGQGAGITINPPINALRNEIADMTQWTQSIRVENVLADNISSTFVQPLGTTSMMRVTVNILYQGPTDASAQTITQLTWVVTQ